MTDEKWWLDPKQLQRLSEVPEEVDPPPSSEEELKQALLEQQRKEHFEAPDPSDSLTDEELWQQTKSIFERRINE
jgi:MoxR-like ATPase